MYSLFPPVSPFAQGRLQVSELHSLYWEQIGTPNGIPVVFLHGGPGSGCSPRHRQFFDPEKFCVTLFDQRGCGRSMPHYELRENNTAHLIDDIENLRRHVGVEHWHVFGGSWGSTLALAYGQAHPRRCLSFILRGIFLGSVAEINWFVHGMAQFFPHAHATFLSALPEAERDDPLKHYLRRMTSEDRAIAQAAASAWARYEAACALHHPGPADPDTQAIRHFERGIATLEAHYMAHACFLAPNALLEGLSKISHLACTIVQGRYDVICPPISAVRLHARWPRSNLVLVEAAGHSASEPGIANALIATLSEL